MLLMVRELTITQQLHVLIQFSFFQQLNQYMYSIEIGAAFCQTTVLIESDNHFQSQGEFENFDAVVEGQANDHN